jgi:hypothetical protein
MACHCTLFHKPFKYNDSRFWRRVKTHSVGTPGRNKAIIVFCCISWFSRRASTAVTANGLCGKMLSDIPARHRYPRPLGFISRNHPSMVSGTGFLVKICAKYTLLEIWSASNIETR